MVFKPLDPEFLRYAPSTPPGIRIARTACAPSSSALVPFREPILHGLATLSIGEPSSAGFVFRRQCFAAYSKGIAYYDPCLLPVYARHSTTVALRGERSLVI